MTRVSGTCLLEVLSDLSRPDRRPAAVDVVEELSTALGSAWDVVRETDYVGEVSIIALSSGDIDAMPTLILYEKGGQAHIGIIRGDDWEADVAFTTYRQAVAAMIATAASLTPALRP